MAPVARGARRSRVAVVGAGIAGLAAARVLSAHADVTLFEAEAHFGGHAHSVDIRLPRSGADPRQITSAVDTGFLVYNDRTYPELIRLFCELEVATAASEMSFSVQANGGGRRMEWSGNDLNAVFAQRVNMANPRFLGMLADLLRFNRLTTRIARAGTESQLAQPLGDFLDEYRFGAPFRDWYFLPMMGCIWSCPTERMLAFPVGTMIRFCHNHGLLQVADRPQWRTVRGGSRCYVDKIVSGLSDARAATPVRRVSRAGIGADAGVQIATDAGTEHFDHVILATHSDVSLAMLADASEPERSVLGAIGYQPNRAVLHTDASVLPTRRRAWAAWNYESAGQGARDDAGGHVCLHYLLNRLQPLPWEQPVIVSLNPLREIDRNHVMAEFSYAHPVFDLKAIAAQGRLPEIQGLRNTWFAGAWAGYGFHEDGLKAGLAAADGVRQRIATTQLLARSETSVGGEAVDRQRIAA